MAPPGYLASSARVIEARHRSPVHIVGLVDSDPVPPARAPRARGEGPLTTVEATPEQLSAPGGDGGASFVTVTLANATPATRVHLLATHFLPQASPGAALGTPLTCPTQVDFAMPTSDYLDGVRWWWFDALVMHDPVPVSSAHVPLWDAGCSALSEETAYVLRRQGDPRLGNMLPRPQLLNSPWAVATTVTRVRRARGGEALERRAQAATRSAKRREAREECEAEAPEMLMREQSEQLCDLKCERASMELSAAKFYKRSRRVSAGSMVEGLVRGVARLFRTDHINHGVRQGRRHRFQRSGSEREGAQPSDPCLDFLAFPATVLANLRPQPSGPAHPGQAVLRIPKRSLQPGQSHLLAVAVDGEHVATAFATILPLAPPEQQSPAPAPAPAPPVSEHAAAAAEAPVLRLPSLYRDRRLLAILDPARHYAQRRAVSLLGPAAPSPPATEAGAGAGAEDAALVGPPAPLEGEATVADMNTASVLIMDSLRKAHRQTDRQTDTQARTLAPRILCPSMTPRRAWLMVPLDHHHHHRTRPLLMFDLFGAIHAHGSWCLLTATPARHPMSLQLFDLFGAIAHETPLTTDFAWLLRWPRLSPAERAERLSQYGCHEVHLWLMHKDPAFFAQVVVPHLVHKPEKTFIDEYLLGADLAAYLRPERYSSTTQQAWSRCMRITDVVAAAAAGAERARADPAGEWLARTGHPQAPRSPADLIRMGVQALAAANPVPPPSPAPTTTTATTTCSAAAPSEALGGGGGGRGPTLLGEIRAGARLRRTASASDGDDGDQEEEEAEGGASFSPSSPAMVATRLLSHANPTPPPPRTPLIAPRMEPHAGPTHRGASHHHGVARGGEAQEMLCAFCDEEPQPLAAAAPAPKSGRAERSIRQPLSAASMQGHRAAVTELRARASRLAGEQFRAPETTREYAERHYWAVERAAGGELVKWNRFWVDYARYLLHGAHGPFISTSLAHPAVRDGADTCAGRWHAGTPTQRAGRGTAGATSHKPVSSRLCALSLRPWSLNEMLLALAVTDLPLHPDPATAGTEYIRQAGAVALRCRPAGPVVLFRKEIRPWDGMPAQGDLLVRQHFIDPEDPTEYVDEQPREKHIRGGRFQANRIYTSTVVLTNVGPGALDVAVLIPRGAIPCANGFYTRCRQVTVPAFSTHSLAVSFYFPFTGRYEMFPAHVTQGDRLIGAAPPAGPLTVVEHIKSESLVDWRYLAEQGTDEEVLRYLALENLGRASLPDIAWRCARSADFTGRVLDTLGGRHVYEDVLWGYAVKHLLAGHMAAYLQHHLAPGEYPFLRSALYCSEPVEDGLWQHLEYRPLINARAHRLGGKPTILNDAMALQYRRTLRALALKRTALGALEPEEYLGLVYYLLLQDRVEDARTLFTQMAARCPGAPRSGAAPPCAKCGCSLAACPHYRPYPPGRSTQAVSMPRCLDVACLWDGDASMSRCGVPLGWWVAAAVGPVSGPAAFLPHLRAIPAVAPAAPAASASATAAVTAAAAAAPALGALCAACHERLGPAERQASGWTRMEVPFEMQRDYMAAYFEFFLDPTANGDLATARAVAKRYGGYPVAQWRRLFQEIADQLAEIDAAPVAAARPEGPAQAQAQAEAARMADNEAERAILRDRQNAGAATAEPSLEVTLSTCPILSPSPPNGRLRPRPSSLPHHQSSARQLHLVGANLAPGEPVAVRCYLMDLEMRFSMEPFSLAGPAAHEGCSIIQPNHTATVDLPVGADGLLDATIPLPAPVANSNAFVEVSRGPLTRVVTHYSHGLEVALHETQGRLTVRTAAGSAPLPRCYVKAYGRTAAGQAFFYKDGYTDLCGTFDYATLSTDELDRVERFALLVLSEAHGALVREAAPPAR
ncbi:putative ATP-dependent RNA helicase RhlE [Paratrimastix pyriformis]|uniref:ATP-dependent RNA helicase RhlE n=1 Tax=Paratrimastix pyriformis TaxID=342808 RepID=A0ABQ8UGM7_9EUKA|nr:putative ATP-dependent RNA helicase RhlE [Paratrimastix pyriformis]